MDIRTNYIKEGRLEISINDFENNSWELGRIFWNSSTNYSQSTLDKIEVSTEGTIIRDIGVGGFSYTRIYVNDGDGKYDYNYTARIKLIDHSGNTYYSDIIELAVPDFNP